MTEAQLSPALPSQIRKVGICEPMSLDLEIDSPSDIECYAPPRMIKRLVQLWVRASISAKSSETRAEKRSYGKPVD